MEMPCERWGGKPKKCITRNAADRRPDGRTDEAVVPEWPFREISLSAEKLKTIRRSGICAIRRTFRVAASVCARARLLKPFSVVFVYVKHFYF